MLVNECATMMTWCEMHRYLLGPVISRDPMYINSSMWLEEIYEYYHPGMKLDLSPDGRLILSGSIPKKKEFVVSEHNYSRLFSYILLPCKIEYIRQKKKSDKYKVIEFNQI